MKNKEDEYLTKDLYEAAAFYAWGEKDVSLKPEGNFFWFVFKNKIRCQKLSKDYWAEEGSIAPKKYVNALQTLRDRLFASKEMKNEEKKRLY